MGIEESILKKVLLTTVILATTGFLINDAYAVVPQFDTYVADDPDDGDEVFSNGDTLTITFDIATNATANGSMSQVEINANFTDGASGTNGDPDFGATYSGVWSADSTTLTITVTDVTGGALTI